MVFAHSRSFSLVHHTPALSRETTVFRHHELMYNSRDHNQNKGKPTTDLEVVRRQLLLSILIRWEFHAPH